MTIYRIEPQLDVYGWFELNMDEVLEALGRKTYSRFKKTNTSIADSWQNFEAKFLAPDGKQDAEIRPDITTWSSSCHLVLNEKAYQALNKLLAEYGEFLPTTCEGSRYYIFNCQTTKPADEANSEKRINMGLQEGLNRLTFDDSVIGATPAFKTDYDLFTSLFCSQQFKDLVEENHLQGLSFHTDLAGSRYFK